jgi:hypothetical protein
MKVDDKLILRLFSSDSVDKFPSNSLSSFCIELDEGIDLNEGKYEVGVTELFVNQTKNASDIQGNSRDMVFIGKSYAGKVIDFNKLADILVESSFEPKLYHKSWFYKFLHDKLFYDPKNLQKIFSNDYVTLNKKNSAGHLVSVEINLNDFLHEGEKLEDFKTLHAKAASKSEKFKIFMLSNFNATMGQMFSLLITQLIVYFRETSDEEKGDFDVHARSFVNALITVKTYSDIVHMNEMRRRHLNKANEMIHRIIIKLIDDIHQKVSLIQRSESVKGQIMFIYCDIIDNQVVGATNKAKIIHVTPLAPASLHGFFEKVERVSHFPVESTFIKRINFLILDEYGNQIDFLPSLHSTYVCLEMKRVK